MTDLAILLPDAPQPLPPVKISGLKLDSRQVTNGDCFVAVPGYQADGRHFIQQAMSAGASVVLQQANSFSVDAEGAVPLISVPDLFNQLSVIASRFYGSPSGRVNTVGVTGTNGKTTVTHLLAQLYQAVGQKAAVMGTLGSGFVDALLAEKNTTPDAFTVQSRLASLANEGANMVAMEVSSHALVQGRVSALQFSAVVATNVSRDHLDYHGSMESYAAAKEDLFRQYPTKARIYNLDDKVVQKWFERAPQDAFAYTIDETPSDQPNILRASEVAYQEAGADFKLHWQGQTILAKSPLLGQFNISNVLAATLVMLADGFLLTTVVEHFSRLRTVAGRMETFTAPQKALAIVDYAHTPDALEQVLKAARKHCQGKLWCVFGCGGDRDRGKRPQMGATASTYADIVVVTDDNPRTEQPLQIIADIVSGATGQAELQEYPGRRDAVLHSLRSAKAEDVVVLAGKGHEDYQIVGTQALDYNEREIVAAFMRGYSND